MLKTNGKECGGDRFKTDYVESHCSNCEHSTAQKVAKRKLTDSRSAVNSAAAVIAFLGPEERTGSGQAHRVGGFLDLYR